MKNIGLGLLFFCIGGVAVLGYFFVVSRPSVQEKVIPTGTPQPTLSVESPPSESLKGLIASRSGSILWESRTATQPGVLNNENRVQQGERIITQENSSAELQFEGVHLSLSENADLSFIQALPIDFVVVQKKGAIKYEIQGVTPLSIRIRSALITKATGEIQITATEGDPLILISTLKGTAQIGFNDLDYVSQVFTLREGQVYEYNSDERTTINTKNK